MLRRITPVFEEDAPVVGEVAALSDGGLNQIQFNIVAVLGQRLSDSMNDDNKHLDRQWLDTKLVVEALHLSLIHI